MRIDLHCHTEVSRDSTIPLSQRPARCWQRAIRVQAITDHNEIRGALELRERVDAEGSDPVILIGEEITTSEGEIVGLFLTERIEAGLSPEETVARIKAQGGACAAPARLRSMELLDPTSGGTRADRERRRHRRGVQRARLEASLEPGSGRVGARAWPSYQRRIGCAHSRRYRKRVGRGTDATDPRAQGSPARAAAGHADGRVAASAPHPHRTHARTAPPSIPGAPQGRIRLAAPAASPLTRQASPRLDRGGAGRHGRPRDRAWRSSTCRHGRRCRRRQYRWKHSSRSPRASASA